MDERRRKYIKEWKARPENRAKEVARQKARRRERKLFAIEYLGGRCYKCDNVFHPAVFEFHHRDPKEKDYDPGKAMNLKIDKLIAELDKCALLCANCHRLLHHE